MAYKYLIQERMDHTFLPIQFSILIKNKFWHFRPLLNIILLWQVLLTHFLV